MGLKRYAKKLKRVALNSNPLIKAVTGGVSNSGSGGGARGEAAKRLVSKKQQAGGGSIRFVTEDTGDGGDPFDASGLDSNKKVNPNQQRSNTPYKPKPRTSYYPGVSTTSDEEENS